MRLDTRLTKLENEQGVRPCIMCGLTSQVQPYIIEYYDESDDPPLGDEGSRACPLCGRQALLIQAV